MSRITRSLLLIAIVAAAGLIFMPAGHAQQGARLSADVYRQLPWRYIGPEGNRFSAAAGVPGDPYVYYVGAASGGIYKTTDGGTTWRPIFDDQPVQSIGALAVMDLCDNLQHMRGKETMEERMNLVGDVKEEIVRVRKALIRRISMTDPAFGEGSG